MKRIQIVLIGIFIVLIFLPLILGYLWSGQDFVFNGLYQNPIDGNTYLSKMMQGYQGEWKFTLSYSVEASEGAYLYLFYFILGHLSRVLSISIIAMFHIARGLSALCMALALLIWAKRTIRQPVIQTITFGLLLFGSGLGWLLLPFGKIPVDFWVAEAYPYLSAMANPHFCLGLAIMLWLLHIYSLPSSKIKLVGLFSLSVLLSIVMQFGVVLVCVLVVLIELWNWYIEHKINIIKLLFATLGGGSFLLYQYFAIQSDPVLAQWNTQNITAAPGLLDVILSFSPAIILALVLIWKQSKEKEFWMRHFILLAWLIVGFLLLYIPFSLQRRFLFGYYVPVVLLAGVFFEKFIILSQKNGRTILRIVIIISLITNVLLLNGILKGLSQHDSHFYLNRDEAEAISWLDLHSPKGTVVLTSPGLGNFVPARSDLKVMYGHPFETIDAEEKKEKITQFYIGELRGSTLKAWLKEYNVEYIMFGIREKEIGTNFDTSFLSRVHQFDSISIYRVVDE